jgi:hypothetical protein
LKNLFFALFGLCAFAFNLASRGTMSSKEFDQLYARFKRVSLGDDLQILGPTLQALSLAALIKELHTPAAPLLIALNGSTIGLHHEESALALLPKPIARMAQALSEGLLEPKNNAKITLLRLMLETLFTATIVATDHLTETETILTFELALRFLIKTELLNAICKILLRNCGILEKNLETAAKTVTLIFLLLAIHTVAATDRDRALTLVENLSPMLLIGIEQAAPFFAEEIDRRGFKEPIAGTLSQAMQHAKIALEENDFASFLAVLSSIEQKFKQSDKEKTIADFVDRFKVMHHLIINCLTVPEDINTTTGIVQG